MKILESGSILRLIFASLTTWPTINFAKPHIFGLLMRWFMEALMSDDVNQGVQTVGHTV